MWVYSLVVINNDFKLPLIIPTIIIIIFRFMIMIFLTINFENYSNDIPAQQV